MGRTVVQIKQESALQRALSSRVSRSALASAAAARRQRLELVAFVESEVRAGRLALTPPPPTSLKWRIAKLANAITVPLIAVSASPLLLLVLAAAHFPVARAQETTDPEICPRPAVSLLGELERLEDFDVTNQYTAFGSLKPGRFRRMLVSVLACAGGVLLQRHVYTRGYLGRVQTIHFARWAFLDNKLRLVFASSENYDGGHQAYMDDFINKVAWGLNLLFSNGIGWPHTDWLLARGARREHLFKYFQRRHQVPTQVWYKAYPGLTLIDMDRNQRIRQGLQSRTWVMRGCLPGSGSYERDRSNTRRVRRRSRSRPFCIQAPHRSEFPASSRPGSCGRAPRIRRGAGQQRGEGSITPANRITRSWRLRTRVCVRARYARHDITENFSTEFVAGMAGDANRARLLGDVGANDPECWEWGLGETSPACPCVAIRHAGIPCRLAAGR